MLLSFLLPRADRERALFQTLYTRYRSLMFWAAMRILHSEADAEDAVAQAFVSIFKNISKFSDPECPKTRSAIVLITERKAIDLLRTEHRDRYVPLDEETSAEQAAPLPGSGGVADAMARLPARYRQALMLRYDSGYSVRETAALLSITPAAAEKLLQRAKNALAKLLDEEGIPHA